MRVAVQSTVFLPTPAAGAGAVEYLVAKMAEGLALRGHDIVCYCLEGSTLKVRTASVQAIGSVAAREAVIAKAIASDWPDVLFDHSLHQLAQRRFPDGAAVTMSHGVAPISPWAHNVVFTSEHHGRLHGREHPKAIHNGIDPADWPLWGPPAPPSPALRRDVGRARLCWIGRLLPYKQPHLALQVAMDAGADLALAGPVVDETYYRRQIRPLLGDGRIHLGELSHEQLPALLRDSDAMLFTSDTTEPAGIVLLEAQASGRPVLAFAQGATPEFVGPKAGRLVGSPSQMVKAINDRFWEGFDGPAARRWVVENRSIDAMIERAEELLQQAASGGSWCLHP